MVIEQVVDLPISRQITLNLPSTIPVGKIRISIFPIVDVDPVLCETEEDSFEEFVSTADKIIVKHKKAFKALAK